MPSSEVRKPTIAWATSSVHGWIGVTRNRRKMPCSR